MEKTPFFFLLLLPLSCLLSAQTPSRTGREKPPVRSVISLRPTNLPASVLIRPGQDPALKDLSSVRLEWEIISNGFLRQRGAVDNLPAALQRSKDIRIPVRVIAATGDEVFLNIRYRLKKPLGPLPAGHRVAGEQRLLKKAAGDALSIRPDGPLTFGDEGGIFTVSSPYIGLQFNKQTGWLQHYEAKGMSLLGDSLELRSNFWRPAADTARGQDAWKGATNAPHLQLFSTSTSSELVIVRADYELPEVNCTMHIRYTINAKGEMQVEQSLDADSLKNGPMLPRFGMQWVLPAGSDSIVYYGPGSDSSRSGDPVETGIYRQTIGESMALLSRVGEREVREVRWWRVSDRKGKGLLITADSSLLSIGMAPGPDGYPGIPLTIDHGMAGLLPYGSYRYAYKVTPL